MFPETYQQAIDKPTRRRIQAAVVACYRGRVEALVRRLVSPVQREEALQVGLVGLLVALEKYRAPAMDAGGAFWFSAAPHVRAEVQKWITLGVVWRHPEGTTAPDADAKARIRTFAATLTPEERRALFDCGRPGHAAVVKRAAAYVRGKI